MKNKLKVGLAQMSPVFLDKRRTIEKIGIKLVEAADQKCDVLVFPEVILPGYPFWLSCGNGAAFNSGIQKNLYSKYVQEAVQIESGDLEGVCALAKKLNLAMYLGIVERASDRGGHSLYCSLVYIDKNGQILSVHRKLQPTYEERLVWAMGDGHGLQVHDINNFKLGGLNCWENWMPLSRMALYGMGENVHIAVWPGCVRNTEIITRSIARESRSYVLSVCGIMNFNDLQAALPDMQLDPSNVLADGGSCIANPDGSWLVEPLKNEEKTIVAELHLERILEERQNFDVSGHYSRPDVTQLTVNRKRQSILNLSGLNKDE